MTIGLFKAIVVENFYKLKLQWQCMQRIQKIRFLKGLGNQQKDLLCILICLEFDRFKQDVFKL
jgi:hypothetical protein